MEMISNCPCFLLQLTLLECFMFHVSKHLWSFKFTLHTFLHPSDRVSCSFSSLVSSPWLRARLRVSGHLRACLSSFFPFPNSRNSLFFFLSLAKLATEIDLGPFRKNDIHSSPRPRCLGFRQRVEMFFYWTFVCVYHKMKDFRKIIKKWLVLATYFVTR